MLILYLRFNLQLYCDEHDLGILYDQLDTLDLVWFIVLSWFVSIMMALCSSTILKLRWEDSTENTDEERAERIKNALHLVPYPNDTDRSALDSSKYDACSICLYEYSCTTGSSDSGEEIIVSNSCCCHVFHKSCLTLWLMRPGHDDCPICRAKILS